MLNFAFYNYPFENYSLKKRSNLCHLQDDLSNWFLISSLSNQLEEIEDHVDAVRKKVKETATANRGPSTGERATYFQSLKVLLKRH